MVTGGGGSAANSELDGMVRRHHPVEGAGFCRSPVEDPTFGNPKLEANQIAKHMAPNVRRDAKSGMTDAGLIKEIDRVENSRVLEDSLN
jgi:hypothetical protein